MLQCIDLVERRCSRALHASSLTASYEVCSMSHLATRLTKERWNRIIFIARSLALEEETRRKGHPTFVQQALSLFNVADGQSWCR